MKNTQPIEKSVVRGGGVLEVHSIFDTIQGEGPFAGMPAVFVRLAGCNLQCSLCDTNYTSHRDLMKPEEIAQRVIAAAPVMRRLVVVTGGEPFRQDLHRLVEVLNHTGHQVQIETNGTLRPGDALEERWLLDPTHRKSLITVVCSPKTPKLAEFMWSYIDAVKYVVAHGYVAEDGLPLRSVGPEYGRPARPPVAWAGEVYVQPLDEQDTTKNARHVAQAVQSCRRYGYRLCLQTHKLCNLP